MTDTSPDTSPAANAAAPSDVPATATADTASYGAAAPAEPNTAGPSTAAPRPPEPPPSCVKLAMRNMVRKGRQSLLHFGLTAVGFIGFILLVAWFGRPTLPQ